MKTFEDVSKQIGSIRPETLTTAREVFEAAKAAGHEIWYIWGKGESDEHSSLLALDFMVRNQAGGDFVRDYLWHHRERLRLRHVIWWQRITSTVNQPGKVRVMEDRGNATKNHYDHVHSWQFAGPYRPPVHTVPQADWGVVQLAVDGELGPKTITRWQQIVGSKADGVISRPRSELIYWVQRYLRDRVDHRLDADGELGPKTIRAIQRYLGAPLSGQMDSTTVKALQRRLNEGRF